MVDESLNKEIATRIKERINELWYGGGDPQDFPKALNTTTYRKAKAEGLAEALKICEEEWNTNQ